MQTAAPTILCVASHLKGLHFMREARRLGCRVYLLTHEKLLDAPWPLEALDDVFALPDFNDPTIVRNAVGYLYRQHAFDRFVPMGDYDVEVCALLREHFRMPGLGVTASAFFRDKLAMRETAASAGIPVPAFTGLFHPGAISDYLARVHGPWVLKPRMEAGSKGIQVFEEPQPLWHALDELGDAQGLHLLEQFVSGDLFHVDAAVFGGEVVFASAQQYGTPMLRLKQQGGVYSTRTIPRGTPDEVALLALNARVIKALGLSQGVTHVEYLKGPGVGEFYFLEAACRVGAAKIPDVIFYATGVCLWHEWARMEAATPDRPYVPPVSKGDHAGVVISVANQAQPDTSAYDDPEIVWRQATRPHHVGLLVRSDDPDRVASLLYDYERRFPVDFG